MLTRFSRRKFMLAAGSASALALLGLREFKDKWAQRAYPGKVWGANFKRGHRLITKSFPKPARTIHKSNVIVGAGVTGLSCAYHLKKAGISDITVFELEDHAGGNAHGHENNAPWGAHYLPLVNLTNTSLLNFLEDANCIKNIDHAGVPEYDELMICSDPLERLYRHGRMQEGLVPSTHLTNAEKTQINDFFKLMEEFKNAKGGDGKYAFDIPMENSSLDQKFTTYDQITMMDYLKQNDLSNDALDWYVNYCCRDDFGVDVNEISAWMGIHYFAARRGKGKDLPDNSVLTWPQGNRYLVDKLLDLSKVNINKGYLLFKVEGDALYFYDFTKNETVKVVARNIVLALPQFILARLFDLKTKFEYTPWVVANIKIKWDSKLEKKLAWDNVNFHGKGLGVISANQQKLNMHLKENILTYYWPITHLTPTEARKFALKRTHNQWCKDILEDIAPMIDDISQRIISVDIWPWGHAMVKPVPDFIFKTRQNVIKAPSKNIQIAHTDLGGISIFEEAFYRGELAAKNIIQGKKS